MKCENCHKDCKATLCSYGIDKYYHKGIKQRIGGGGTLELIDPVCPECGCKNPEPVSLIGRCVK